MRGVNKVIFNTGFLYFQLILGMILGIISTRILLKNLGDINYGIYILVAGVIGALGVLNSNMSNTSMRFLAYSLGSNNLNNSLKTFNTTICIHFLVGLLALLIMELGGYFVFKSILNIPPESVFEAKIVFHLMVISTFVMVISVPYDALINAHEDIFFLSVTDIIGYVLKLIAAIAISMNDKFILTRYGIYVFTIELILRIVKREYCRNKYIECRISVKKYFDKELMVSILKFTGWNLFGSLGALVVTQLRSVMLNSYFGVKINTADGIANNGSNQINLVASNVTKALNPRMVKSEGGGHRSKMIFITIIGTKYSTFLLALVALPVIFEVPYLLKIWLVKVPPFTTEFIQLLLFNFILEKFTFQITEAIRAVGDIMKFQIIETLLRVSNLPLSYYVLQMGYPPYYVFLCGIIVSLFVFFNRLYFGKKIIQLNIWDYIKKALLPVIIPLFIAMPILIIANLNYPQSFYRVMLSSFGFVTIFLFIFWRIGMDKEEKQTFSNALNYIN